MQTDCQLGKKGGKGQKQDRMLVVAALQCTGPGGVKCCCSE